MSGITLYDDNPLFRRFQRDELETAETDRYMRRKRERMADPLLPPKRRKVHSPSYSVQDLHERWGVSTATLYNWIKAGKISGHKFGGCVRVDIAEVVRFENEAEKDVTPTYSVPQIAAKLNCCAATVRRGIKSGRIKAFRKLNTEHGHWYISKDEMNRISLKK